MGRLAGKLLWLISFKVLPAEREGFVVVLGLEFLRSILGASGEI